MDTSARRIFVLVAGLTFVIPAIANAGIPMLALAWPAQWLALIPVVVVESAMIANALGNTTRQQLWPVAKANLLSTLVGIPIAWLAMLALEAGAAGLVFGLLPASVGEAPAVRYLLFPFMAAWIVGSSKLEFQVAFLVLALPFCAVSVFIEHRSLRGPIREELRPVLRRAVRRANVLTYALLCLAVTVGLAWA